MFSSFGCTVELQRVNNSNDISAWLVGCRHKKVGQLFNLLINFLHNPLLGNFL